MKYIHFITLLALVLCLAVLLMQTGCGASQPEPPAETAATAPSEQICETESEPAPETAAPMEPAITASPEEDEPDYGELVSESRHVDVETKYTAGVLSCPHINLDSPDAAEVNAWLEALMDEAIAGVGAANATDDYISMIDYILYVWGAKHDILSLHVTTDGTDEAACSVDDSFWFRISTGERVEQQDVLTAFGITEAEYEERLMQAQAAALYAFYGEDMTENELRALTQTAMQQEYLEKGNVFIDEYGLLWVNGRVPSPDGQVYGYNLVYDHFTPSPFYED